MPLLMPPDDPCSFCEYLAGRREVYSAEGVAVWQNNGRPAHQSVPHVHFHVAGTLPGGGTDWGTVPTLSIAETDAIAARLRLAY